MKKGLLFMLIVAMAAMGCKESEGHDNFTREITFDGQAVLMEKMQACEIDGAWHFLTAASFGELDAILYFGNGDDFYDLYDKNGHSLNHLVVGTDYNINHYYWNDVVSIEFKIYLKSGEKITGGYFDKYTVV